MQFIVIITGVQKNFFQISCLACLPFETMQIRWKKFFQTCLVPLSPSGEKNFWEKIFFYGHIFSYFWCLVALKFCINAFWNLKYIHMRQTQQSHPHNLAPFGPILPLTVSCFHIFADEHSPVQCMICNVS